MSQNTNGSLALNQRNKEIIVIAATKQPEESKLRVAAYCRVSTDSEDQLNSFAAQYHHYFSLIAAQEKWTLVDIYADEGITGTSAEKRTDFQRLLKDCRDGKVDRILVKSISRFSRNTKECLEILRELKSMGITVRFEKENIDTNEVAGEMATTIYAALAQGESESIANNVRWGIQKRMESGTFQTGPAPFGYRWENGSLVIEKTEAKTVRQIFDWYLAGVATYEIAERLTNEAGNARVWSESTVAYILTNERYAGDALFQKRYTTDTLPFKRAANNGEHPMYYVRLYNPPILSREDFDRAQMLRSTRASKCVFTPRVHPLTGKVVCGSCRRMLRTKVNRGISYMVCRVHSKNPEACPVSQIPEQTIYEAFCRLCYKLRHSEVLSQMLSNQRAVRTRRLLWRPEVIALNEKISNITNQSHTLAVLKQQGLVDSDIFISKSNALAEQLRKAKLEKERCMEAADTSSIPITSELMVILSSGPDFLDAFDEKLFCQLIDRIIVDSNTQLRFRLKNGLELREQVERTVR